MYCLIEHRRQEWLVIKMKYVFVLLVQGLLRNERENALLAVIEETKRNVSLLSDN